MAAAAGVAAKTDERRRSVVQIRCVACQSNFHPSPLYMDRAPQPNISLAAPPHCSATPFSAIRHVLGERRQDWYDPSPTYDELLS